MRRYLSARTVGHSLAPCLVLLAATTGRGQIFTPTYGHGQGYPQTYGQAYAPGQGQTFTPAPVQRFTPTPTQSYTPTQTRSYAPVQGQGYAPPQGQVYNPGYSQAKAPAPGQFPAHVPTYGQTYGQGFGVANSRPAGPVFMAQNGVQDAPLEMPAPQPAQEPIATPSVTAPQSNANNMPPMGAQQPTYDAATYGYSTYGGHGHGHSAWSQGNCAEQASGYPCYSDQCTGDDCGYCPPMTCPPTVMWSVRAGALLMFRDYENHRTFSYDSAIESNQLLDYRETEEDILPGVEIGVTRFNCCTCTGWEALYWGLYPSDQTAQAFASDVTGNLDPIYDFSQLDYNGASADNFVNAAAVHRLRRSSEIHNAELNRLWGIPVYADASPWRVRTLAGFRYFRLEENLEFASDVNDTAFTGEADELYYRIDTENDLFGGQIGALVERQTAGRFSFTFGAKAGVFCNSASASSFIGGSAGAATINNGPFNGQEWRVYAEKEDVAFLGEAKAGVAYQIGQQWRLLSDYRVIGVSGVALPTNQMYHDLRGINDVQLLGTNGSLFLHGVFIGAERVF